MSFWSWLLAAGLLLLGALLGWLVCRYSATKERVAAIERAEQERVRELRRILSDTRNQRATRYEILIADWGPDFEEMRYRWTVWDADRILAAAVDPTSTDPVGNEIPFMLGNTPAAHLALADATDWVMVQQDADGYVSGGPA